MVFAEGLKKFLSIICLLVVVFFVLSCGNERRGRIKRKDEALVKYA
jgi:hypothetical protein